MTSLLPPSATPLARAIEAATNRFERIPDLLRESLSPDDCPEHLLTWLAWANSVDVWRESWPVDVKRAVIKSARSVHQKKGTAAAVKEAVAAFGSDLTFTEWFEQQPMGAPYTFRVEYTPSSQIPNTAQFQRDVAAAINRTKPCRSGYELIAGLNLDGGINISATARATAYRRLTLEENA